MTTWQTIPNSQLDQDSPVTQDLFTLVRDNPIAISEGSTDSPILRTGIHPYDATFVDDGNYGEIYDFATDGAVATLNTPNYEAGYEYYIVTDNLGHSDGAAQDLRIRHYLETTDAFANGFALVASVPAGDGATLATPNTFSGALYPQYSYPRDINGRPVSGLESTVSSTEKVTYSEIRFASGNINSGKIYLLRQRVFNAEFTF